ncbi:MAG: flavodoxin family protein [Desulfuromonadales bacterium]|nr:flavodoxin family protein [Desulfuromonadales bacterium]
MKKTVVGLNGSPRKNWNTATLLERALEGAAAAGARTELIHLDDLTFRGCSSCFECKRKGGPSYGRCALRDELTPLLERLPAADAIFFASPVYIGAESAQMRAFMERFLFPYIAYSQTTPSLYPKKIPAGFIYTMNVTEEQAAMIGFDRHFDVTDFALQRVFGSSERLLCTDTCQFDDYSAFTSDMFDAAAKRQRRLENFPEDCRKAFAMGERFALAP